jgi:hypothetical protein
MLELCAACTQGGGAVDRGTALQAGRSRVRVPMEALKFFIERADNLTTFMCRLS